MKLLNQSILAITTFGLATVAMAADPLANTTWQTYEDGKPKALVRITESGGVLTGKIISGNTEKAKQYVGRTVITGLKAEGGGKYAHGRITNPVDGKSYGLAGSLSNGNRTLKLTAYWGVVPVKSQTWRKH
ncbi:DUF2147 domain-containing protein [Psychrobacter sp. I-STPA6b]|uniref:DUF2147 domain-containing protein n=1 Tax=Psychrobacter sp. I-STPA6b TaxID=2585718 RepID=UPI001D0C9728|nr:DUF2147 domain-containing protein [Psychrobacter sp. I-STPA6b]